MDKRQEAINKLLTLIKDMRQDLRDMIESGLQPESPQVRQYASKIHKLEDNYKTLRMEA